MSDLFSAFGSDLGSALGGLGSGASDLLGTAGNVLSGLFGGAGGQTAQSTPAAAPQTAAQTADTTAADNSVIPPTVAAEAAVQGPQQPQQPQPQPQAPQDQQFAPQTAVNQLRRALSASQRGNPWQTGGPTPSPEVQNWENEGGGGRTPRPLPTQPSPGALGQLGTEGLVPHDPSVASDVGEDAVNTALGPQTASDAGVKGVAKGLGDLGGVKPGEGIEGLPTPSPSPLGLLRLLGPYGAGAAAGLGEMLPTPLNANEPDPAKAAITKGFTEYPDSANYPQYQPPPPAPDPGQRPDLAQRVPLDQTPQPPQRGDTTVKDPDTGRTIHVRKRPDGSFVPDHSVPTKKRGTPTPDTHRRGDDGISPMIRDAAGVSTGNPAMLMDLARLALPLMAMAFAGGGGGRGGFRGGRRGFGLVGPQLGRFGGHFGGRIGGQWPYHHPQFGWGMHRGWPGPGWLPMHPRHMQETFGGSPGMEWLGQLLGGGGGQNGEPQGGGRPQGVGSPSGGGGNGGADGTTPASQGPWSLSPFLSAVVGAESSGYNDGAPGQPRGGDNGQSTGYYNIKQPTWRRYGGTTDFPWRASPEEQTRVAMRIPVREFGPPTRAKLHAQFGQFPENMTLGQLADHYGGSNWTSDRTAALRGKTTTGGSTSPNPDGFASIPVPSDMFNPRPGAPAPQAAQGPQIGL